MSYKFFMILALATGLANPTCALALTRSGELLANKPAAAKAPAGPAGKEFKGNVSWYGVPFHGRKTASGEIFNMNKLSAAHLRLPFKTRVMVEDPKTGKSVVVKVNDRGPYACKRVMDLSKQAATDLGTISRGVAFVECTVLDADD